MRGAETTKGNIAVDVPLLFPVDLSVILVT